MSISRSSVPTLVDRGRQKKKSSGGDKELASLEKNIYGVPRVIEEDAKKLDKNKNRIRYTKPIYHPDGSVTPGRPIPPKE
jgi:hypothetical protein|tara:strand:- start:242 stop:481 length:240 start_codon:yes stop_codon:yes gene_type:complete